jgi:hypothetical protein
MANKIIIAEYNHDEVVLCLFKDYQNKYIVQVSSLDIQDGIKFVLTKRIEAVKLFKSFKKIGILKYRYGKELLIETL